MSVDSEKNIYECGTLKYTRSSLIITAALIMLGFFCFIISTSAVVNMIPIHLRGLKASNTAIAFIVSTIGSILNMTVCPAVSFKSDRYRGKRWGRRCYFIISTLPMYCLSMILFAVSDQLGSWISALLSPLASFSSAAVTIVVIGVIMAIFKYFYMYVGSVIYYIYNDIIPSQFLSRVVGMTNVATAAGGAVFSFVFFKYAESHFTLVMIICAAIYGVLMTAVCFLLKEPRYPELTEDEKKQSRGSRGILTFLKESFSSSFYFNAFVGAALVSVSFWMMTFMVFLHQNMGMDLEAIGNYDGTNGLIGMGLGMALAAVGTYFVDRWHPTRVYVFATWMTVLIPLLRCRLYFISPTADMYFFISMMESAIYTFCSGMVGISSLPALMQMFPKSRFGQFCSARALLVSLTGLVMGFMLGVVIDFFSKQLGFGDRVYRLIWFWYVIFTLAGTYFLIKMFCQWKRAGGENGFKAPAPWNPEGYEKLASGGVEKVSVKKLKIGFAVLDVLMLLVSCGAAGIFGFCRVRNYDIAAASYLKYAVFPAIILGVLYILWRISVYSDMKNILRGTIQEMLHHGVLFIGTLLLLAITAVAFVESKMVIANDPEYAGRYYLAHTIVAAVLLIIFAVANGIEKRTASR